LDDNSKSQCEKASTKKDKKKFYQVKLLIISEDEWNDIYNLNVRKLNIK
jgi:hypothetical protein